MRHLAILALFVVLAACPAPRKKPVEPAPSVEPSAGEAVAGSVDGEAATEPAASAGQSTECAKPKPEPAQPTEPAEDPLEEMSALGELIIAGDPDAGGSIRAKRVPPLDALRSDPCRLRARVDEVTRGRFPLAAVRVRILEPPKKGAGTELRKNDVVVVLPRLETERGQVRMHDPETARNAGVYYLAKGDRVLVCLEKKRADGLWWAGAIERD